jgi:hypothetical protein
MAPADRQRLLSLARAQYCTTFSEFQPAAVQVEGLRAVLADARRAGIATALFVMPEAKGFQAFYAPGNSPTSMGSWSAGLREGVPLINARDWVPDDGFVDGHHLLADGAALFTDRFGREAVQPLLGGLSDAMARAGR